jgi:hypothetical protein
MSTIEESITDFAKSLTTLAKALDSVSDKMQMSVESHERLADRYEQLLAVQGTSPAPPADEKPKGKPGRPPKAKEAPPPVEEEEDDGLGDDAPAASTLTRDDVKAKLVELREVTEDKLAPRKVMEKFGASNVAEIKDEDFQGVYDAAVKAIKAHK